MTVPIFLAMVTSLSLVDSLLTEAIKKSFKVTKPTLVAAVLAIIVGWGGGACAYLLKDIPFTTNSIICLGLMAPIIWLCATLGYDKVMEIIRQILGSNKVE